MVLKRPLARFGRSARYLPDAAPQHPVGSRIQGRGKELIAANASVIAVGSGIDLTPLLSGYVTSADR